MFAIIVTYTAPLSEIDANLAAHREFLAENFAAGRLLLCGPQVPREGGLILASGSMSRAEVEAMVETDPFKTAGVADYRIVEFTPNVSAPGLEAYKEV